MKEARGAKGERTQFMLTEDVSSHGWRLYVMTEIGLRPQKTRI